MRMRKTRVETIGCALIGILASVAEEMAGILKTFLGSSDPENQPSGEEMIAKLKTR